MDTPPLIIDDLTFRYRDRTSAAIEHVSFAARPGEILLIAGASGCGKTTLIRAINGLIPRSYKGELSGKILIHGEDSRNWSLARISQQVGTVLQDPERQILGTKVLNEVAFGLENLGLARGEILERVNEALDLLNISHLQDRETFNLSGGEKQKVALAGVLAMRPNILLLDEPLASLDPASAQDTLDTVRQLADQGMAVLMVEHRVEDVLRIHPDRVLFMAEGELRYLGDISGLTEVVNYHEIKLPAELVMQRAAADPPPEPLNLLPSAQKPDPSPNPLVHFEQVSFGYEKEHNVLHGIDLDIQRGDVIAVLGPNGAGKTTFVKHAIGLLKPKSGGCWLMGTIRARLAWRRSPVRWGMYFKAPATCFSLPPCTRNWPLAPPTSSTP